MQDKIIVKTCVKFRRRFSRNVRNILVENVIKEYLLKPVNDVSAKIALFFLANN